jgi:hypothetical protein
MLLKSVFESALYKKRTKKQKEGEKNLQNKIFLYNPSIRF